MRHHVIENNPTLQPNTKWSRDQKKLIIKWLQEEYRRFINLYLRKPKHYEEEYILDSVMERVHTCDVWIPYEEVKTYFLYEKGKWYRKLENEFEDRRKEEEQKIKLQKEPIGTWFI